MVQLTCIRVCIVMAAVEDSGHRSVENPYGPREGCPYCGSTPTAPMVSKRLQECGKIGQEKHRPSYQSAEILLTQADPEAVKLGEGMENGVAEIP